MQKLGLRSDRDTRRGSGPSGNAVDKRQQYRQKDGHRSRSFDSNQLLRPKTKSKSNKSANRKSSKVLSAAVENLVFYVF